MNLDLNPAQLNTEQLLELVRRLIAENEKLRTENAQLRAEIEELKRKNARPAAPFSKNKRKKNPKRPGRRPGQGKFRNRTAPSAEEYSGPVEDVPVKETACPECGGDLIGEDEEIGANTEIPEAPAPEVKAYRVHSRTCCRCQRKVRGRHPEVAPDQFGATAHRLGPRAQAAAHTLHYGDGIPQRKVPRVLRSLTGLVVTQGALAQSAIRLGTGDGPVARRYQQLRVEIRRQEAINTDDTGWRINGYLAQLMAFDSRAVAVYQIRLQHRNEEVREVIGNNYQGILGTDRGKSYDAKELIEVKQQKCIAHIQRSIDEALEGKRGQACGFGLILKSHERGNLLRFLHEPTVIEPTNNAAERALRPAVIARKVSHCSKNEKGAAALSAFKSVIQTIKKQGGNVLETLAGLIRPAPPPELDFQTLN